MADNAVCEGVGPTSDVRSAYWRAIALEAAISALANIGIGGLIAWLHFRGHDPAVVWGASGFVVDLIPSSFIPAFLMVLLLGLVIRKRRANGQFGLASQATPPAWISILPKRLIWRATVLATVVTLASLALATSIFALGGQAALPLGTLWLVKAVHNGAIGLVCGALVAACAMSEPRLGPIA